MAGGDRPSNSSTTQCDLALLHRPLTLLSPNSPLIGVHLRASAVKKIKINIHAETLIFETSASKILCSIRLLIGKIIVI
jgi:hypothetical protein